MATIALNMIVKDSAAHLERTLESIAPLNLDEIIIVDTGSTDKTPEIARKQATTFGEYKDPNPITIGDKTFISSFSAARNFAMSLTKSDYIFWIDSDDILVNAEALKEQVDVAIRSGLCDSLSMIYDYHTNRYGMCTVRQARERFARREMYVWKAPVHEVLCATSAHNGHFVDRDTAFILHEAKDADKTDKRLRNVAICEQHLKLNGEEQEPRFFLNYGRSLFAMDRFDEVIPQLDKYLADSEWNEERYFVYLIKAEALNKLGKVQGALESIFKSIELRPEFKDAYVDLAGINCSIREHKKAIYWADKAIECKYDNSAYQSNPLKLNIAPHEIKALSYLATFDHEKAIEACDEALKIDPFNKEILMNKALASRCLREQEIVDSVKKIEFILVAEGNEEKVISFRKSFPKLLMHRPEFSKFFPKPFKGGRKLAIYCGQTESPWGYDSIEKGGVGGSETAVIRLSKELANLGWHVEVFGYPTIEQEGEFNGVYWYPYWRFDQKEEYDVFVSWRSPEIAFANASTRYVWLHDTQVEHVWNKKQFPQLDGVFALSKAHQRNIPWIPDDKVILSQNGLDPSFFKDGSNEPHRLIYASCPSRGLHLLLPLWPRIKEKYPEAKLDIFYGFTPHYMEAMKTKEYLRGVYSIVMASINQPGVAFHGMVSQNRLAEAFAKAGIWAYPTNFPEISCITAMQAQVNGAVPVCTGYWALSETVQHGKVIGGPEDQIDKDPKLMSMWLEALYKLMDATEIQNKIREKMIPWARKEFLWSKVAQQWNKIFKDSLQTKAIKNSEKGQLLEVS